MLQRLNDLRATLNKVDQMNKDGFAGADAGVLDLDRIGLIGRSHGATTTLMGLAMEPRFTAGFAVVPPGWADPRPSLLVENLASTDEESVRGDESAKNRLLENRYEADGLTLESRNF